MASVQFQMGRRFEDLFESVWENVSEAGRRTRPWGLER